MRPDTTPSCLMWSNIPSQVAPPVVGKRRICVVLFLLIMIEISGAGGRGRGSRLRLKVGESARAGVQR